MPRRLLLVVSLAILFTVGGAHATPLDPAPVLSGNWLAQPLPLPAWDDLFDPALLAGASRTPVQTPEPQTFFLIGFGLLALGLIGTRTLKP